VDYRELPTKVRRSVDLWVAGLQAENPDRAIRRFGEVRRDVDDAYVVSYRDELTGDRFEVSAWPDGRVGAMRETA
jgi:hypothetical protein